MTESWFFEYQALLAACAQAGFRVTKEPDPNYGGERTALVSLETIGIPGVQGSQRSAESLEALIAALHCVGGGLYTVQAAFVLGDFAKIRELLLNSDAATKTGYAGNIRKAAEIARKPIWRWSSEGKDGGRV